MNTKTILITGGTTGIGFACAEYLLANGYKVIITGRSDKNMKLALDQLGDRATGFLSDTSNLNDMDSLVEVVKDKFGKIDGLFVNAGIFKSESFETTTEELFDETMNINFKGAFFTVQKFLPIMNNPSSIVLTSSIVVFKAFALTSVYTASKAALESLAGVLNVELAQRGIRTNILAPGVTESPIQQKSGMSDEAIKDLLEHFSNTSPIGRILNPKDMAPVLEFLVSEKSLVLRNEKIIVDGGTTM
ncbi:SDR family oxidoreductase [Fulvivirga kasyanovii]|uniref:SDR family oxidoreductase n=1 Tax=Fulvivirga kasyanovii TaxID=396812 RepID=A0ABW9RIV5_9BACT|nr:SDR family oxidoreductase [Fulvivirga kasyanovii]MTI23621.1 SDR family oxidoreductase [Fulvivirga kasyanovii]